MSGTMRADGLTKDHLYVVGTSPSLRWAGVKGKDVFVEVATYDAPHVTLRGLERGQIEFPVEEITQLRAGVEYMKTARYRCVIRRRGGRALLLHGTMNKRDYRELVLHLAEELQGLGHFDRVERGLCGWEVAVHLLIFGGLALVACFAVYDGWLRWGGDWDRDDYLMFGGLSAMSLIFLLHTLWTSFRWYRPREVRDLEDLAEVLP